MNKTKASHTRKRIVAHNNHCDLSAILLPKGMIRQCVKNSNCSTSGSKKTQTLSISWTWSRWAVRAATATCIAVTHARCSGQSIRRPYCIIMCGAKTDSSTSVGRVRSTAEQSTKLTTSKPGQKGNHSTSTRTYRSCLAKAVETDRSKMRARIRVGVAALHQDRLIQAIRLPITKTKLTRLTNRGSIVVAGTDPLAIVKVTITTKIRIPIRRILILAAPKEHHSRLPVE